jgi:energy-converting hydrogenase Eha subunit H
MKDALIFLTTISLVIFVVSYFIILLIRMNDKVKYLMIENNTLKHDLPSRIVDTYRVKVREDNLRATIECGITHKGIKIIFEDTSGKFGDEMLDEYELTPQELLNILQRHDE